jgi:hypothetical protein
MIQTGNRKLLFFGRCSMDEKMFIQGVSKVNAPGKVASSPSAVMSGSGLFVKNPKSNAVIAKTGILYHFPMK